ncbi:RNA polymerase sigma-70 factor [Mucilaginibacter sp. HC2]|uniref:RNA polymerase sigma-70 factor n=1 Tax=Mucilaginibacter inviolabilis TaxID=2714892 RepID=UPI00140E7DEE|nr:RNA polymerase sigma-70 factor [Mucilaginibacter inviolabilis]NHA05812.1 RNA polymerase sigma-70 factor [Mucilaginibacter inviolabilis]
MSGNNKYPQVVFHLTEQSFQQLYRTYWKKVFAICYHTLRDEDIAAELSQDIFESLWKRRNSLQINVSIEQYIFRSAKLEVFEYCRTTSNRQKHLQNVIQNQSTEGTYTEDTLNYNELYKTINRLINRLPYKSQEVYRLSQQQGLDKKSIASALLISEKTVEYHLYKALNFLRDNLAVD